LSPEPKANQLKRDGIVEKQLAAFWSTFGRDPEPGDPFFFDPNKDVPTKIETFDDEVLLAMRKAGIDLAIVYAFRKTGLMLISDQVVNYSPEAIAEWNAARPYHSRQRPLCQHVGLPRSTHRANAEHHGASEHRGPRDER
jgi:hypothetical protein